MAGEFVQFRLIGAKQLERALRTMSRKESTKAIKKATRAGSKLITQTTKALAPRKTGQLRRAIKTRVLKTRRRKFGAESIGTVTVLGQGFFKGDEFYGAFLEFGYRRGKRQSVRETEFFRGEDVRKKIPGIHFMERGAKQSGTRAGTLAARIMQKEILAAAAKIPKQQLLF